MRTENLPHAKPTAADWWGVAIGTFFFGALAGLIGPGVLTPYGYNGLGSALFWLGTIVMVVGVGIVGTILFARECP